jgi:hypothetical protein
MTRSLRERVVTPRSSVLACASPGRLCAATASRLGHAVERDCTPSGGRHRNLLRRDHVVDLGRVGYCQRASLSALPNDGGGGGGGWRTPFCIDGVVGADSGAVSGFFQCGLFFKTSAN